MEPEPHNQDVIKIAKKVFRYDGDSTRWGWTHDMYYDKESNTYLIANFPDDGQMFEMSVQPEDGPAEVQTSDGESHRIKVFEQ